MTQFPWDPQMLRLFHIFIKTYYYSHRVVSFLWFLGWVSLLGAKKANAKLKFYCRLSKSWKKVSDQAVKSLFFLVWFSHSQTWENKRSWTVKPNQILSEVFPVLQQLLYVPGKKNNYFTCRTLLQSLIHFIKRSSRKKNCISFNIKSKSLWLMWIEAGSEK